MNPQPKFIQINISNACNSRCPGCPITLSQRNTETSMSEDDFIKIIDLSLPFIASNPIHLQFGIGNTLMVSDSLIKYINILSTYPQFYSTKSTIEISATLLSDNDKVILQNLFMHIKKATPKAQIIIECIISPTISADNLAIVESNISHIKSFGVEMHIICRYTNGLKKVGDYFIKMIEDSLHIDLLTIDFFFRDQSIGSKYTYIDFENWCIHNYKNPLINYPLNDNFCNNASTSSDDFLGIYFDQNMRVFPLVTTPFGDMILDDPMGIGPTQSPISILSKTKRYAIPSQNPVCKKCSFYDICPSNAINSMHNSMNIPITSVSCFFGKKLLTIIQEKL